MVGCFEGGWKSAVDCLLIPPRTARESNPSTRLAQRQRARDNNKIQTLQAIRPRRLSQLQLTTWAL
jgi:hypothetical protein